MKNIKKMMAIVLAMVMVLMYSVPATFALTNAEVAPTGNTLTANGSQQPLVTAGSPGSYTMQYKMGEADWTTTIPTAKDKGTYNVQWRVVDASNSVVNDDGGSPLTGTVTATIGQPAYDMPLTVTGLTKGDTVKFYKVIEWAGDAEGNVGGWKAVAPFDTILTKDKLKEVLVGTKADDTAEPPVAEKAKTGITSELAGQLAAKATTGVDGTLNDAGTIATLENPEAGLWMALVTPTDANTIYNPVFVSADYESESEGTVSVDGTYDKYSNEGVAKKSTVTLTKTAEDKTTVDTDKQHTVAVGDVLDFTVNTQIPGYGNVYEHPKFDVTDTLSGLQLVGESIEVKTGSTTLEMGTDKDYTLTPEDYDKGTTYTIAFTEKYLKSLKTATPITITYDATVTDTAQNAINQTDNEVTITYSHDPNNQSDYDVKKDTTQHYTFTLDASGIGGGESTSQTGTKTSELVKTGVDANGDPIIEKTETSTINDATKETWEGPLEGAVFGLFTDAGATTALKDKDGADVTATTGTDGRMTFAGLDAGTYYLKEISAPTGYVTSTEIYKVDIVAVTEPVTVTETVGEKEVTYETDVLKSYTVKITDKAGAGTEVTAAEYTFENVKEDATSNDIQWTVMDATEVPYVFENVKGTELPSTGGIGTTLFYVFGLILVVGAGVLIVTKRRMKKFEQ